MQVRQGGEPNKGKYSMRNSDCVSRIDTPDRREVAGMLAISDMQHLVVWGAVHDKVSDPLLEHAGMEVTELVAAPVRDPEHILCHAVVFRCQPVDTVLFPLITQAKGLNLLVLAVKCLFGQARLHC